MDEEQFRAQARQRGLSPDEMLIVGKNLRVWPDIEIPLRWRDRMMRALATGMEKWKKSNKRRGEV